MTKVIDSDKLLDFLGLDMDAFKLVIGNISNLENRRELF